MISKITGTCYYSKCGKPATHIAEGRWRDRDDGHPLGCYCREHAQIVTAEGAPEYIVDCPNCGCKFGVN